MLSVRLTVRITNCVLCKAYSIGITNCVIYKANSKGKVFYGQEPPSGESTTTEYGVNYQLLAVY